ncbi:MAG TPA: lytic murein transglycosylase [Marmoricola sp.]|nr:lytic murein transglycosylase [Marmoricola sp.]
MADKPTPAGSLSRRAKALTIVPVAILSGLWTASLVTTSATAAGPGGGHRHTLPDGTRVPTKAITAPASVPVPGVVAPGVPDGTADAVISGASTSGIPAPALAAYQRASQVINTADKGCNIPWELIAAIGRVESDHGRFGGNVLTAKGISEPGIYGPVLDGRHGTQAIPDTDGGLVDHDKTWDRAVGPMQFIPSTWSVVKVDADGDGQRNPQDINDAALATAVYLCSGNENLSTHSGQEHAVYRYNHSQQYVDLVLRLMEAYSEGDYTAVPAGTSAGTLFTPDYASAVRAHHRHARPQHPARSHSHRTASTGSTNPGSTGGSGSSAGSGTSLPSTGSTGGSGSTTGNDTGNKVKDAAKDATNTVKDTTKTVTNTAIGVTKATQMCTDALKAKYGSAPDQAVSDCVNAIKDETLTQAQADLAGVVADLKNTICKLLGGLLC